ncbi:MAG: SPOR domain-containing protein [Dysgonamonadaceae bacterium]|nr:SPOR domain-containing protein [Dysgonamonadaceae bacterium]
MKKLFTISFLFCGLSAQVFAQSTIMDSLQEDVPGQGVVRVESPDAVNRLVGRRSEPSLAGNVEYIKVAGYRVQVFAGNQQRSSKAEVFQRQQTFNEAFPDIPAYVTYNAPYWRLRVGDCLTYEEAYLLMKRITKQLPNLKKEMYVVKDEIKVPANTGQVE